MEHGDTEKFKTKKSLGQHFLNSATVPRLMCDAAGLAHGELVLEIGPGTGALTRELLARGVTVIALEADLRALEVLKVTFALEIKEGRLRLVHADVRTLDLSTLAGISDHTFKVVSNIPYYLSGMLFRIFLESPIQPNTVVYLVQKEVAKRIVSDIARGEKGSLLSLSVKAYASPRYVKTVSRGHFNPPPNVDSAIIALEHISRNNFAEIDEKLFFKILHLGFGQKRKQLLGNLAKQFDRVELTNIFSTLSLSLSTRAEDVPLSMWLTLVKELKSIM